MTLALLVFFSTVSLGQSTDCGCLDNVIITLDENCQFNLTVENVQAGPCGDDTYVSVSDVNPSNGGLVDCPGTFEYGIFRGEDLVCWGTVTAEDKSGPIAVDTMQMKDTLECHLIEPLLNNPNTIDPNNKYYLGEVLFRDNCTACGCIVSRTFSDQLTYADCAEVVRTGVYAEMIRHWTAIDCEGYRTQVTQKFVFVRPSLDSLRNVSDTVYQSCSPDDVAILTRYPYWIDAFGDKIPVNELDCDYATTIEMQEFPTCDDGSFKQENYVRVFDWCQGGSRYVDTFLVKVGDFEGPVFTGIAQNIASENVLQELEDHVDRDSLLQVNSDGKLPVISTGPMDCTAALSLNLDALRQRFDFDIIDCNDPTINVRFYSYLPEILFGFVTGDTSWTETNYPNFNELATGIPIGIHAMVIEANDGCESFSTGLLYFMVKDQIAPVMKCDDALTVSLTTANPNAIDNEAYARLDAVDVDEGSWDNCELGFLKIRRGVAALADCEAVFIKYGYDGNGDGKIDANDWFDENNNGIFDPETEYKWEFVDGLWFTPWRDFAEFFCCDVDRAITIELGGWDNARDPLTNMLMRNHNICWQNTVIEDSSIPNLTPLPTMVIKCTDEITEKIEEGPINGELLEEVRAAFGETVPFGIFCGEIVLRERFVDRRDRCGFGSIDRIIDVEKMTFNKGTRITTIIQNIQVKEVFDYSICFPADVAYNCENGPDTIPGMTYESNGCDLIATFVDDEQFDAVGETDACFKIFRTYSLINWCEYDGESLPVIVSRDWERVYIFGTFSFLGHLAIHIISTIHQLIFWQNGYHYLSRGTHLRLHHRPKHMRHF